MVKEHRPFVILKVKDKWCVFCFKKKVSPYFFSFKEAEDYKKFLRSR